MNALTLAAALLIPPALIAPALAEAPAVYPTPKQCAWTGGSTRVSDVRVEMRRADSAGAHWEALPATPGGYSITVEEGRLTIRANDKDGLYYARQTLSQLLQGVEGADNAQSDPFPDKSPEEVARLGKLPLGTLIDWPDLPDRGVVEGYYGTPWSTEDRLSLFRFFGRNKMNIYIYGPKDDPWHHGQGCYKPYPKAEAREIARLVKAARQNHVRFVWAIHPANTVNWNQEGGKPQLEQLCAKMEAMYRLGVRDFGVFVDDSAGEILRPERQAQLCNHILEHFIRKHPKDVTPYLIMVPTGYNKGWTNPHFLRTLGSQLDASTRVMWTGDSVVNDITLQGQRWVHEHLGRPTYIWWNWPCSDFKRGRLSMGRTYGLGTEPDMRSEMTGFVANPMEQAEANKVALFSVADYCWNTTGFRSEESWHNGIRRLYPQCAGAMQSFCDHNSYLLPNVHKYHREESVAMHETAGGFIRSVNAREPDRQLAAGMQKEYRRMAKAGETLQEAPGMEALQKEIAPWLKAFTLTGQAGDALVASMLAGERKERLRHFFKAVDCLNRMRRLSRMDWNGGKPRRVYDVEVASYIMTPAMREAFGYCNSLVYADISGRKPTTLRPLFSCNCGNAEEGAEKLADGRVATYWDSRQMQRAGDWVCLDFGESMPISSIGLLMGTATRAEDYAEAGQMEYSDDGQSWHPIGRETRGASIVLDLSRKPIHARMLRYRITEGKDKWLTISEFCVNRNLPAYATATVPGLEGVSSFRDEKMYGINRIMELHRARPGDVIELHFPGPVKGTWLEIDLGNADIAKWAKAELKMANGKRIRVKGEMKGSAFIVKGKALPKGAVLSMRLTHIGKQEEQVRLNVFKLDVPAVDAEHDPAVLTDKDFATAYDCSKGLTHTLTLPSGTTHILTVGTADCTVNGREGKRSSMLQVFPVTDGERRIQLHAPARKSTVLNELIFRMRK